MANLPNVLWSARFGAMRRLVTALFIAAVTYVVQPDSISWHTRIVASWDLGMLTHLDFAYFALVVGMTSQVSDVAVASRSMRCLALIHGSRARVQHRRARTQHQQHRQRDLDADSETSILRVGERSSEVEERRSPTPEQRKGRRTAESIV